MNQRKKLSGWALLVGGLLLALPALAAEKDPEACVFACNVKATEQVSTCNQSCPPLAQGGKEEPTRKCLTKCSEKHQSSLNACTASCPKPATGPKPGGT